jgi:hypothetical protein
MSSPPRDYSICPCCGTEFGYHDAIRSHEELRNEWIRSGARWHSSIVAAPLGWNWIEQLADAAFLGKTVLVTGTPPTIPSPIQHIRRTMPFGVIASPNAPIVIS